MLTNALSSHCISSYILKKYNSQLKIINK